MRRPVDDRGHGLGHESGERPEPRAQPRRHDHGPHATPPRVGWVTRRGGHPSDSLAAAPTRAGRTAGPGSRRTGGGHAALGDDRRDVRRRGDVERWVAHAHALGRHPVPAHVRDLARVPLLDRDVRPIGDAQVDGREGRRHVEGHAVLARQHRHRVGADLVGRVAVGGDAVGSHHHVGHQVAAQEVPGHVVGDQLGRDALVQQFPGRQPRALQKGPGLVDEDVHVGDGARRRRGSPPARCRSRPSPGLPRCSGSG